MIMTYFDPNGPQVTHTLHILYMQWWRGYRMTPVRPNVGYEFYYSELNILWRFRLFLNIYFQTPLYTPAPGDLESAYLFPWNGVSVVNWSTLPDFITSSFQAGEQQAYFELINGPGLTIDDAGKKALLIFERALENYNFWLETVYGNNDGGVLLSPDTRIKSTHYWSMQRVFLTMIAKWIPPSQIPSDPSLEYKSRYRDEVAPPWKDIPLYGEAFGSSTP